MKNKMLRNILIPSLAAVFVLTVPTLLIYLGVIDGFTAQIVSLAGVNAIMAISVNMVCGITGQLSLGQAGFQAIGAYSVVLLCTKCGVPLPLSVILGGLIAAFFGFLIGFPTLKLEGDYLAIVTLAFGEIIRVVLLNLKSLTGGPNGMTFPTIFTNSLDFGATLSYLAIIGTLVLVILFLQNFLRSTYGRAILAVREDEVAANSSGISVFRYKMIGFVIAAFIGGIGGALYAPFIGFIKPDMASFNNSITHLTYVVLGGMGSVTGSVVAAFVMTILLESLRFLSTYRLLIYPVLLILVMLFRPQGLLGTRELSFVRGFDKITSLFARKKSVEKSGGNSDGRKD